MPLSQQSLDQDLAARLAELEALYRATPVALCVVDRNLRFTRANNEYAQVVGRRVDEIIGHSMAEVVHPATQEVTTALVKRVIETGRAVRNLELPGVSRTEPHEELVWLVNIHPVETDGKVTGAIGVLQNVTPVKNLERMAQERLEEIETLYRNLPIGIGLLDTSLRFVRVNNVLAELNGRRPEEHPGRYIFDLLPDLSPVLESDLRRILDGEELPRGGEIRICPPNDPGVPHDFLASYELVHSEDGAISGIVASVLDVTDRVRAEEEARAARDRAEEQLRELEFLYANAPAGLCLMDPDLRVLRINDSLAKATGLPRQACVGKTMYELAPGLMDQVSEEIRLAIDLGRPGFNLEVSGPLPADPSKHRSWLLSIHPMRERTGPVSALIAVVQDITAFKRQQAELEEVKARLEEAQRMSRIGSWEWNIEDDVMWWSEELYEIAGRSRDEARPTWTQYFEMVHQDDRSEVRRQLDATLETDAPYWVEFRFVRHDLRERVLRCAARLERSSDGRPQRLFGTCQDVTSLDSAQRLADRVRFDVEST